ncbi:hypothetical protein M409DRAFT_53801 [Zasmidium cellare ATCC 36951]|uniref:Zn(2)-C6 fungal-type domain-containing protein n=1 Tax=Zasmidium cellare ATCC 36951 TaxID=1080233 RepID=A0A6A6CPT7_ZASCE|nr:uncharacterized protein M409DRAFT_53801 [Zasmidium cellare ATCC 36951]KAF2167842.1 hypothetical protein M409DRAFT_53801 [Zasmidium cellare ATCC 36951]
MRPAQKEGSRRSATQRRQHPTVRGACEACHNRKVRCELPPEGGPCSNCVSASRPCFFLPRIRSGRPRNNNDTGAGSDAGTSGSEAGVNSGENTRTTSTPRASVTADTPPRPASSQAPYAFDGSSMPPTTRMEDTFDMANPATFDSHWDFAAASALAQLDSAGLSAAPNARPVLPAVPTSTTDPSSGALMMDPMDMDHFMPMQYNATMPDLSPSTFARWLTGQPDESYGVVDPNAYGWRNSTQATSVPHDNASDTSSTHTSTNNAPLPKGLDLLSKLQSYVEGLSQCFERHKKGGHRPDLTMKNRGLQTLLQAVDCTCTNISERLGPLAESRRSSIRTDISSGTDMSAPIPKASIDPDRPKDLMEAGLVFLAAIFKILHAFELISGYNVPPEDSADLILLYKRCEFNLTQTKMALMQIAQVLPSLVETTKQATSRAIELESHFASAAFERSHDAWT